MHVHGEKRRSASRGVLANYCSVGSKPRWNPFS
jgi:hypothetical protein